MFIYFMYFNVTEGQNYEKSKPVYCNVGFYFIQHIFVTWKKLSTVYGNNCMRTIFSSLSYEALRIDIVNGNVEWSGLFLFCKSPFFVFLSSIPSQIWWPIDPSAVVSVVHHPLHVWRSNYDVMAAGQAQRGQSTDKDVRGWGMEWKTQNASTCFISLDGHGTMYTSIQVP